MHAPTDSEMLIAHDWSFPVPIAYGPGRLAELGARCVAMGVSKPLIVTDRASDGLPYIAQTQDSLAKAGLACAVFSEISPNPRDVARHCPGSGAGFHSDRRRSARLWR